MAVTGGAEVAGEEVPDANATAVGWALAAADASGGVRLADSASVAMAAGAGALAEG